MTPHMRCGTRTSREERAIRRAWRWRRLFLAELGGTRRLYLELVRARRTVNRLTIYRDGGEA